jgi:hypothetical protein
MDQIVALVIPFIALAILSVLIDRFTLFLEGVMHRIPKLPDQFEWWVAYALVLGLGYVVCWQGDFNLFNYLDFRFWYAWEGYLLTALVISGGSTFIRTQFSVINDIPSAVFGTTSAVSRFLRRENISRAEKVSKKKAEKEQEVVSQESGYNFQPSTPSYSPSVNNSVVEEVVEEVVEGEADYSDSSRYTEI